MIKSFKMGTKIILINPGHGGIIDDVYQTAPKKMYLHQNGDIACEGVINRGVADYAMSLINASGIKCINLCPTNIDVPLDVRVKIANFYCDEYGKENVIGIDLHSNAGKGAGFEGWTSPGQTPSDDYMTLFIEMFSKQFPSWKIRTDFCDKDPDKESPFYMLVNTKCSWILPEWGFFDNLQDWNFIKQKFNQLEYANMIADFAKEIQTKTY